MLEGVAGFIALACLLFWLTYGIDWVHYQFRKLELPASFRVTCTILMTVLLVGLTLSWILSRLFRSFKNTDLALALERRNPRLRDRLITAVELSGKPTTTPLQQAMLERTSKQAAEEVAALDLQSTFNPIPLRRMAIAAGVLLSSVLMFGIANAQGMERWFDAYILGKSDYWDPFRKNAMHVQVIAQPGDRIREFDAEHIYKHPRGADLQLLAISSQDATPPDESVLQFISFGGSARQRGRVTMSRINEGEFRHTITRVVDDHHLWITGGDYVNRLPLRIQVVDPPQIDSIHLKCNYPEYLGRDSEEDRLVPVVGVTVDLPMETEFDLLAKTNKPLVRVQVRCNQFQLSFGFEQKGDALTALPTRLSIKKEDSLETRVVELDIPAADFFNADRTELKVPLHLTVAATTELQAFKQGARIPLAPETGLQIYLEDQDQIYSPEPSLLTINSILDQPPVVDTRRTGIGTVITRMANIPIEGRITDDYGVSKAWFGYRVDGTPDEQTRPLFKQPAGQSEFVLGQATENSRELFNMIPLKLEEGQTLTLGVYAQDGDVINGPHQSHGELFTFKVVSKEDLLGRLYDREVNLRLRFEQIRSEIDDLKTRLTEQLKIATTSPEMTDADEIKKNQLILSSFVERSLHQIRKNHTESRSIEVSFRDLREEMINNRIDSKELLDRVDNGIIAPLKTLNEETFLEPDRKFGVMRLSLERNSGIEVAFTDAVPSIDELLRQMDKILNEMRSRGTFNDLIQNLQELIEKQKKVLEDTEDQRIKENFFLPVN